MFCGQCGTENDESFQYCQNCGDNLAVQAGKVISEMDGLDLKEQDTEVDIQKKIMVREILYYYPLRDGEEVLDVALPLDESKRKPDKKYKVIFAVSYLLLLLAIFPINNMFDGNLSFGELMGAIGPSAGPVTSNSSSDELSKMISQLERMRALNKQKDMEEAIQNVLRGVWGIALLAYPIFMSVIRLPLQVNKEVLIATNHRVLGRGAGSSNAISENKTLFNLEIGDYYTQGFSQLMGIEKFTLTHGDKKWKFFALDNLDATLDKIEEARNAESFHE